MMRKALGMAMLVAGMFFVVAGCDSKKSGDSKDSTGQPQQTAAGGGAAGLKELTLDLGNGAGMKLVQIPAGKFLMGSPKDEKDRQDNEGLPPGQWENGSPQLEVTISKPFYMGVTPVTEDQIRAVREGHRPAAPIIDIGQAAAIIRW